MTAVSQMLLIYSLAILLSLLVAGLSKGIVAVSGWWRNPSDEAVGTAAPPVGTPTHDDIAVIAATVYMMTGTQRIVHIENLSRGRTWTASGRAAHYASHHLPRHKR